MLALVTVRRKLPLWADVRAVFVELSVGGGTPAFQGWLGTLGRGRGVVFQSLRREGRAEAF